MKTYNFSEMATEELMSVSELYISEANELADSIRKRQGLNMKTGSLMNEMVKLVSAADNVNRLIMDKM